MATARRQDHRRSRRSSSRRSLRRRSRTPSHPTRPPASLPLTRPLDHRSPALPRLTPDACQTRQVPLEEARASLGDARAGYGPLRHGLPHLCALTARIEPREGKRTPRVATPSTVACASVCPGRSPRSTRGVAAWRCACCPRVYWRNLTMIFGSTGRSRDLVTFEGDECVAVSLSATVICACVVEAVMWSAWRHVCARS